MFKLVVVGGKQRGKEFVLKEGEIVLGRDPSCEINLGLDGISKRHVSFTVTGDTLIVQDLGSSNGTFLNGKIVKKGNAKAGDKISLPNAIFQVVKLQEKKVLVKKQVAKEAPEEDETLDGGPVPQEAIEKIKYSFKYKIMKPIYGVNQEYEWRVLLGIFTVIFVVLLVTLTIFPVLESSKTILLNEIANRGAHYAEEISRINTLALEKKNLERVDTSFLDTEDGVVSYELFDLEGRILRPIGRLNEYISDNFSVQVRDWALKNKDNGKTVFKTKIGAEIGIGKKIMAYSARTGTFEPVGIIAIKFAPRTLVAEAANSTKVYMEAMVTSLIVAVIFFGMVYYLSLRPLEEIKLQIEEALRGKRRNLESIYLMEELGVVRSSVNTILQRMRELQNTGEVEGELESDESYVNVLKEFMEGASSPVMILNSEKNLMKINTAAEDVTSIRQSSSEGLNILDISREKGFAATIIELCDSSAQNLGTSQRGRYELQGREYNIFVNALMGKDNFAKAYYIAFGLDS